MFRFVLFCLDVHVLKKIIMDIWKPRVRLRIHCVIRIRLCVYHRATNARNIAKAAGLPRIVKYSAIQSIWGVAVI